MGLHRDASDYSFEPSFALKVCDLSGPDYHVLNWLAVLLVNLVKRVKQVYHSLFKSDRNAII